MDFTIFTSENFKTNKWSGGTTTELFIYPPTADYQNQDFNFRLSTAKVEAEKSEFTSLPGVSRKIIILDGEITINHEGHNLKKLGKFDIDSFEGSWKTFSEGICTDFNLMTIGETRGDLSVGIIDKNQSLDFQIGDLNIWLFIYIFSGKVNVVINNNNHTLNQHNLLIINKLTIEKLKFRAVEKSELIFSKVKLVE